MRKLIRLLIGAVVLLAVAVVMLLSASIYTFARLTDETLVAQLQFEQAGPDRYLARLNSGDFCTEREFEIQGDQWRIDAEFIKWHYWANALGFDSQYRLDRFEGRFSDVARQNRTADNAYSLSEQTSLDLVEVADSLGRYNFLVDVSYGSSTYQTIDTGRIYEVYRSQTGLLTRSRPVSRAEPGDALAIEISQACGTPAPAWARLTAWIDRAAGSVL